MTYQNLYKLFLLFIFTNVCFNSFGESESLILTNETQKADLTPFIEYYKDSFNNPIHYISDPENTALFKPVDERIINFPSRGDSYWLRFNLLNQSNRNKWMFDIDFPTLRQVTVYILNSAGEIDTIMFGGTDFVKSNKLQDYSSVTHPLNIDPGEFIRVYVNVQTDAFFILPVKMMTPESYIQKTIQKHSLLGIFFGIILTAMMINLLLFARAHERHTVILLLFLVSILLFVSQQYGFLKYPQSFMPEYFKIRIRLILYGCIHLFFNLYTIRFLDLKKFKKLFYILQGINIFMIIYFILVLLPFISPCRISSYNPFFTVATLLIWTGAGIFTRLRHHKQSTIYLISVVSLLFSSLIWLLLTQNKIPLNFFSYHISIIGLSVFSMLLTMDAMGKMTQLLIEQQKAKQLELQNQRLNTEITQIIDNQSLIRKLSTAIENSENTIIITNNKGEIEYTNPAFTKTSGYTFEEVTGKKTSILKSDYHDLSFYMSLWATILSGKTWNGEICNQKKNGELFWESVSISPVTDPNSGTIINFVAIKEDISVKKQQIEELTRSEEQLRNLNATKDKFFSIIAHDLIDPFNALIGFSNILTDALKNKNIEDSLEYASYIQQSAQRVFSLLQNLLIWSRTQSGKINHKPNLVNIRELVADTLVVLLPNANSKEIDVGIEIGADTTAIIDYNMIGTVIRNLLMNAIKFTDKGGSIVLKADNRDNFLNLTVSDTGCGISEKHMGQLFRLDKTFSTKGTHDETGTGLGLIICKEFIEIHKGTIWAESIEGKGSEFHFRIPDGLHQQ